MEYWSLHRKELRRRKGYGRGRGKLEKIRRKKEEWILEMAWFGSHSTVLCYIEEWLTHNSTSKHKPTTTFQRNQTKKIMKNVVEATILTGKFKAKKSCSHVSQWSRKTDHLNSNVYSARCDSFSQVIITQHKDNHNKCVDWIRRIHASHMDSCKWNGMS